MRKDTVNSENMFTRSAYSKGTSFIIGIPAEITRLLKIKNKMHFTVHLIDGMVIYKPIDTTINSKHISKITEKKIKIKEEDAASTPQQIKTSKDGNEKEANDEDLLEITKEEEDTDIDFSAVEEL